MHRNHVVRGGPAASCRCRHRTRDHRGLGRLGQRTFGLDEVGADRALAYLVLRDRAANWRNALPHWLCTPPWLLTEVGSELLARHSRATSCNQPSSRRPHPDSLGAVGLTRAPLGWLMRRRRDREAALARQEGFESHVIARSCRPLTVQQSPAPRDLGSRACV